MPLTLHLLRVGWMNSTESLLLYGNNSWKNTINNHMSGIDRLDQMISYYSCPKSTVRWYTKSDISLL